MDSIRMNGFIVCHGSTLLVVHTKGNQIKRLCLSGRLAVDKWVSLNIEYSPKHTLLVVRQVNSGFFLLHGINSYCALAPKCPSSARVYYDLNVTMLSQTTLSS